MKTILVLLFLGIAFSSEIISGNTTTSFNAYLVGHEYCMDQFNDFSLSGATVVDISADVIDADDACDYDIVPTGTDVIALKSEHIHCMRTKGHASIGHTAAAAGFKAVILWESLYVETGESFGPARYYWYDTCNPPIPVFMLPEGTPLLTALESTGKGVINLDVTPNGYNNWVYYLVSVAPRCMLMFGLCAYKLYICFNMSKQRKKERMPMGISSFVIGTEALASLCAMVLIGDLGYSTAMLPFDIYNIFANIVALLPNLSTALVALTYLDVLVEAGVIKRVPCLRGFIVFLAIFLPLLQILVTLVNSQIISLGDLGGGIAHINLLIVLIFNIFASTVFLKYKRLTFKTMSSSRVDYKLLKMATMMKLSAYLSIIAVICFCGGLVAIIGTGSYDGLSWSFFFSFLAYALMGIIQLLSLRGSEDAGFNLMVTFIVTNGDSTARSYMEEKRLKDSKAAIKSGTGAVVSETTVQRSIA